MDIKYLEVGVLQLISSNTCDSRTAGVGNIRPKVRYKESCTELGRNVLSHTTCDCLLFCFSV